MAFGGVFDPNAFDAVAFHTTPFVTDTTDLTKPVDFVLAKQIAMQPSHTEWEIPRHQMSAETKAYRSGVRALGGSKPSYTTKTGSLHSAHKG